MAENANGEEYLSGEYFEDNNGSNLKFKIEKFLDSRYFVALCLVFMSIASFLFGRLSVLESKREPIKIINNLSNPPYIKEGIETKASLLEQTASVGVGSNLNSTPESGQVIGSKNSNKYHYPWCAGAKTISEKNKIVFSSIEEARAKGYLPATNCKGLK